MTGDLSQVPVHEPVQLGNTCEDLETRVELQSCELIGIAEMW